MADNPPPLPRIRASYLLGLSNKPYKEPRKRPPLDSYRGMLSTPGAAIEWAASDGRRGKLIGKGKPRLLSALDAAVQAKSSLKPAVGEDAAKKNGEAVTTKNEPARVASKEASNDTHGKTDKGDEVEYKKDVPNPSGFTDEQDKTIMRMKNERGDAKWDDIAEATGKSAADCKERFKHIKPDGWVPANVGKGGKKGGGQGGQHGKGKNHKQDKQEQKKEQKKDENSGGANGEGDPWGGAFNMFNDTVEDTGGATDSNSKKDKDKDTDNADNNGWGSGNNAWDNAPGNDSNKDAKKDKKEEGNGWGDNWGATNTDGAADQWGGWGGVDNNNADANKNTDKSSEKQSQASPNPWDADGANTGGAAVATTNWDPNGAPQGDTWGNEGSGGAAQSGKDKKDDNPWAQPDTGKKSSSRAHSKDRHSSKHSSRRGSDSKKDKHRSSRHHNSSYPVEYKVAPDDTFSQDDLKLIARILQQDCSMVWDRLSWRFKDKTGRNLHPDVFEKKITGKVDKERRH